MEEKHDKASGKPHCAIRNQHLVNELEYKGGQREVHDTHVCKLHILQLVKSMSQNEARSSSEEIKPVALSIAMAEGIT